MAVVYEVTCQVDEDVAAAWLAWIGGHIDEMLALPGFVKAELGEVFEPRCAGQRCFVVWYRIADEASLHTYLSEHAGRMRNEGVARFAGRFTAERRFVRGL